MPLSRQSNWETEFEKSGRFLGLGLSFADVAVLEAPWFLDREYTEIYQHAIFDNNARLARLSSANNRLFRGAFHPSIIPDCRELRTMLPTVSSAFRMTIAMDWSGWKNFCSTKPGNAAFFLNPAEALDFAVIVSKSCVPKTDQNRFCESRWDAGRVSPAIRSSLLMSEVAIEPSRARLKIQVRFFRAPPSNGIGFFRSFSAS